MTVAEQWTNDNPGSVDVGVLQSAIADLGTASSAYFDAKRSTETISATLDGWSGEAADAWRMSSADLASELTTHRQRLLDAKSAISSYRSTCLDINNRASVHRATISDAVRVLSADPPRPDVDNYDEWQQDYLRWQMKQQQALDDQSYAYAMLVSIADERGDADQTLVSALSTALPPNWSRTAAALADVGVTGTDSLWRSSLENGMDELARRVLDGDPSSADMDALRTLLSMYSDNGPVLSRFFTRLGGEDTLRLVDSLGSAFAGQPNPSENTLPYDLAADLRAALSVASADWDAATAGTLTSSMLSEDARYRFDGNAAIAFLFGDPDEAPMGAEFSFQLAVGIDEIERVDGEPFRTPDARFDRGANSLVYFDDPDAYERTHPDMSLDFDPGLVDGTGAVFETLGEYPDKAFEFVGSDDSAKLRIEYWFGQRDWGVPDGFEGPGALWLGASQVEGGPAGPVLVDAVLDSEASMTARIIDALAQNPAFLTENISGEAGKDFGIVFAQHLDEFAQQSIGVGMPLEPGRESVLIDSSLTGDRMGVPIVDPIDLFRVAGQIGGTTEGAIAIIIGSEDVRSDIMATAGTDPTRVDTALQAISRIDGILDGSRSGATLAVAEREDDVLLERIDAVTGAMETIAGFAPIPGGPLVGGAVGIGVSSLGDLYADAVYEAASRLDETRLSEEQYRVRLEDYHYEHNAELLYRSLGDELGVAPPPDGASAQARADWAYEVYVAVDERFGLDSSSYTYDYQAFYLSGRSAGHDVRVDGDDGAQP